MKCIMDEKDTRYFQRGRKHKDKDSKECRCPSPINRRRYRHGNYIKQTHHHSKMCEHCNPKIVKVIANRVATRRETLSWNKHTHEWKRPWKPIRKGRVVIKLGQREKKKRELVTFIVQRPLGLRSDSMNDTHCLDAYM